MPKVEILKVIEGNDALREIFRERMNEKKKSFKGNPNSLEIVVGLEVVENPEIVEILTNWRDDEEIAELMFMLVGLSNKNCGIGEDCFIALAKAESDSRKAAIRLLEAGANEFSAMAIVKNNIDFDSHDCAQICALTKNTPREIDDIIRDTVLNLVVSRKTNRESKEELRKLAFVFPKELSKFFQKITTEVFVHPNLEKAILTRLSQVAMAYNRREIDQNDVDRIFRKRHSAEPGDIIRALNLAKKNYAHP